MSVKIMMHELWANKDELDLFCLTGQRGDDARKLLEPGYKLIWTCESNSHFEAMTRYYEFRSWGEYTTDFPDQDKKTYKELG
jgi:hypothetical protein